MNLIVAKNNSSAIEKIDETKKSLAELKANWEVIQNGLEQTRKKQENQKQKNTALLESIESKTKLVKFIQGTYMPFFVIFIIGAYFYYDSIKMNPDFTIWKFFTHIGIFYLIFWVLGVIIEKANVNDLKTTLTEFEKEKGKEDSLGRSIRILENNLEQSNRDIEHKTSHLAALEMAKNFQSDYQVYRISNVFDNNLSLYQNKISNDHLQNIVRLRSYIEKQQDIYMASLSSFEKVITNSENAEQVEKIVLYISHNEKLLQKSYNLAVKMLEFHAANNMVDFFKIYNGFEELGIFSSAAEKKLINSIEQLSMDVSQGIGFLIDKISDLNSSIDQGLNNIEFSIDSLKD